MFVPLFEVVGDSGAVGTIAAKIWIADDNGL